MPTTTHLVAHVAHQRFSAIDTRERLLGAVLCTGKVVLATCHRVEVYESARDVEPVDETRTFVDEAAVSHLFHVATGLDSAIAGEPQILRQIRSAYVAAAVSPLDPLLRLLFQRALHVGRQIRRSTRLGEVRRSVGSLAVDHALGALHDPARATVLVIGAGEMGKLAVRSLSRRVTRVLVANRDLQRAEALAATEGAEALRLQEVAAALERADAVISAADTRGTLLTRTLLAPRVARRGLVLVDIAVPRSVAEEARALPGLAYRSVDDLVGGPTAVPARDIAIASERCAQEARTFMREWRERAASETIRDVRAHAESLRHVQLRRALRRLGHLGERDRRVVEALSIGLTSSLLHAPTLALREEPSRSESARELFGLGQTRS